MYTLTKKPQNLKGVTNSQLGLSMLDLLVVLERLLLNFCHCRKIFGHWLHCKKNGSLYSSSMANLRIKFAEPRPFAVTSSLCWWQHQAQLNQWPWTKVTTISCFVFGRVHTFPKKSIVSETDHFLQMYS